MIEEESFAINELFRSSSMVDFITKYLSQSHSLKCWSREHKFILNSIVSLLQPALLRFQSNRYLNSEKWSDNHLAEIAEVAIEFSYRIEVSITKCISGFLKKLVQLLV